MKRQSIFSIITLVLTAFASSVFTSCQSYHVASRYTSHYIKDNQGHLSAQVSESFELGQAMLALTAVAQNDSSLINRNTLYYSELMTWMKGHEQHKGVKQLNALLARNPQFIQSYLDGLYAFDLHEGRFALKTNYRIDLNRVDFKRYALLLESFNKATRFHEFFMAHQDLYAQMQQVAQNSLTLNMAKQQGNAKGYRMVLSPLTGSQQNLLLIKGHAYTECILFPRLKAQGTNLTFAFNNATADAANNPINTMAAVSSANTNKRSE
jgi:hypothetical protein